MLRKYLKGIALSTVLLNTTVANAEVIVYTGKVSTLRSHESSLGPNNDWFALKGLDSAGACPSDDGGVVIRLKDDEKGKRQFSMVMAAYMADKTVRVHIDDNLKDQHGYCFLRYVDFRGL